MHVAFQKWNVAVAKISDEAARQRERRLHERELVQRNGRGRNTRTKCV